MKAKLFMNGRSQAVRLPKEFRFEGSEVSIRRDGDLVVLEPIAKREWPTDFFSKIRVNDDAFTRPEQPNTPVIIANDALEK